MSSLIQFVYPAIFVKGEGQVCVSFPDLGIVTEGESYEEAFLFAKDYLRVYCEYAIKCGLEISEPSLFETVDEINLPDKVMLIDAMILSQEKNKEK
ncbi:MAG: hypothetical protein PHX09_02720 [Clostridia bacterium]|nr:hypothetical protein [Clostridia bacterium]MDD4686301.1 hypothetical protein [Clostridia bacterium]